MSFEEKIKKYAYEIGIDLIGITTADPFQDAYQRLCKLQTKGYLSPWAERDLHKRCQPRLLMKEARTLIAVAISYLKNTDPNLRPKVGKFSGQLARFAQVCDYHLILKEKMQELVAFIKNVYPMVQTEIYVDTGPLIDREVAWRAGLGFIGKNSALINPIYGSFLALGEILLDIPLTPDKPLKNGCDECTLCLEACPQQVIKAPGEIQTTACLAHYTQEKGLLPPEARKKMGLRLWGCDTCQDVCPYNQQALLGRGSLATHNLGANPDLEQILRFSKQEYQEAVAETPMAWRGKTVLQRNALINLGNLRDPLTIPLLKNILRDQRPVIRGMAAWALGQIPDLSAEKALRQAYGREKDLEVIKEISRALANFET